MTALRTFLIYMRHPEMFEKFSDAFESSDGATLGARLDKTLKALIKQAPVGEPIPGDNTESELYEALKTLALFCTMRLPAEDLKGPEMKAASTALARARGEAS